MKKRGAPTKARLSNALNRWNRWQTVVIVTLGFVVPANAFLFFFSYLPNRTTAAVSSEDTAPKTILESIGSTTAIPRLPPGYSLGQVAAPSDMVLHRSGEWSIIALSRSDGTVVARFSRFAAPEEIRRAAEEDLRQAVPQASHLIENKESIRNMSIVWITLSLVGLSLVASVATLLIALRALEKGNRSERAGDKQLVILPWGGGRAVDLLLEELERRRSESEDGLKETSDASGNGSPAIIRLATEGDAQQIAAIYAPIVTDTIISFELEPPTAEEMRRRIEVTLQRYPWLVCERHHDGRLLGYAYAGAHHSKEAYQWSVDVSVYVHEEARRKGVGARPVCLTLCGACPPGLLQRLRRGNVAKPRERWAARVDGFSAGWGLPGGRLQAGRLARRDVVAPPDTRTRSGPRSARRPTFAVGL
jgi:hypothetical protein